MEKKDFWIFDYLPTFNNLLFPEKCFINLKKIVDDKKIDNHIIIYGGSGYGKNTLINCVIHHCYNIHLSSLVSHHEFTNVKYLDKVYLMNLDVHNNNNICQLIDNITKKTRFDQEYKILIINNLDRLSKLNQIKLSYLMEKKYKNFRLIGISSKINQINLKIKKQCYNHRLSAMDINEFKDVVIKLGKVRNITFTNFQLKNVKLIYKNNNYNFKKSLLMIQYMLQSKSRDITPINTKLIHKLLNYTCGNGYTNMQNAKDYIFILIGLGINVSEIIKICVAEIIKNQNLESEKKIKIIQIAAELQSKSSNMDRPILVLDNFIISLNQIFIS
tara:strand:- start:3272 stop:4261 length:990 start_codon:yes stop_codon:yes gene_type:complete